MIFMNGTTRTLIIAAVTVLLLGGAYAAYNKLSKEYEAESPVSLSQSTTAAENSVAVPNSTEVISTAPAGDATDFTFYDAAGNAVKLSDFRGKRVVLNFWASWCSPCRSEMPVLQAAYDEYGDDIQFLMVNLSGNGGDSHSSALKVISEGGYTFPVFYDDGNEGARAFSVSSIPCTFIIDADGNLTGRHIGMLTESTLGNLLK